MFGPPVWRIEALWPSSVVPKNATVIGGRNKDVKIWRREIKRPRHDSRVGALEVQVTKPFRSTFI